MRMVNFKKVPEQWVIFSLGDIYTAETRLPWTLVVSTHSNFFSLPGHCATNKRTDNIMKLFFLSTEYMSTLTSVKLPVKLKEVGPGTRSDLVLLSHTSTSKFPLPPASGLILTFGLHKKISLVWCHLLLSPFLLQKSAASFMLMRWQPPQLLAETYFWYLYPVCCNLHTSNN